MLCCSVLYYMCNSYWYTYIKVHALFFCSLLQCMHFQQYFSYIVTVSFIGEGNRSIRVRIRASVTRRKPPTRRKSLTHYITQCCIEYTSPSTGLTKTIDQYDILVPVFHSIHEGCLQLVGVLLYEGL